ncbi:PLP-dependent aminotransferase family protein [Parahaliea mediterranea]|uniref:PLP-dependent aminotransferase family protein n=1 Tax=Parahaliea mediterranea TaxID=651086 RepID=A0A939DEL4_9GAMM|nr:PLP-dependent aminotransferase family protein [Parahaliea mediterranea]MBN7796102.1 PLP-dependent aminotransferase family protein [Parahaliea mediterranea]
MKRYEQLAQDIADMIKTGVLAVGERVPSVRHASKTYRVSPSTVYQAYYLLENRGMIRSRPRSGYFVCSQPQQAVPRSKSSPHTLKFTDVDVSELVFSVLGSLRDPDIVPLGSAFPNPTLFPMSRLARSLANATRTMDLHSVVAHLPEGNQDLRRHLVQRYAIANVQVPLEEVVITDGALEALNLCLQAIAKPGDLIAIETPAFYASLQALERLQLKAIEIPVDPHDGIDLQVLAKALKKHPIKACWFMTTFQNPMGATLSDDKKRELVSLLTRHQVPLIEDDVYNELYYGRQQPKPAKAFDSEGYVMHCSSFSKSLAPGYRVGWVAAGRFSRQVERLKLMTTLSASIPAQLAVADYLQYGGYDRHLRKLRHTLEVQQNQMRTAIDHYFPKDTRVTRPEGGYFLWLELPENVDSLELFNMALQEEISIAPGPIFSATRTFRNCIRLNYGNPWDARIERAMKTLGKLASSF